MASDSSDFSHDLDLARQGDREALNRLLATLETRLLAGAKRRLGAELGAKTRASDLMQDAYVEVVQRIGEFAGDSESSFYSWVTAILESSVRQRHRHMNAQKRKPPTRTSEFGVLAQALFKRSRSPVSHLQEVEELELVSKALGALRQDHRFVIEQIVVEQRTTREVADELGRSETAVRMLLSRARAALALEIEKLDEGQS